MTQGMERLGGTSEDDEEEEELEGDMEMDVKEEDDDEEGGGRSASIVGEFAGGRYFLPPPEPPPDGADLPQTPSSAASGGGRRSRPTEEKERTRLRERHRRAITGRILSGLRRHGNYNLRVRADINEVIAALAREAGWVVLPDGTTYPPSQAGRLSAGAASSSPATPAPAPPSPSPPFRGVPPAGALRTFDHPSGRLKGVFTPPLSVYDGRGRSVVASVGANRIGDNSVAPAEDSPLLPSAEDKQIVVSSKIEERCFAGTPYVPVYVMLPLDVINNNGELADPEVLVKQFKALQSVKVDGVMVDCWWGIVEAFTPQVYNWTGYKQLFQLVRQFKLKLQVVMSFHECGGNVGDDVNIPLPHWVTEIGKSNLNIYFTDREGRYNMECLSWGIDKERVLQGRTAVENTTENLRSVSLNLYADETWKVPFCEGPVTYDTANQTDVWQEERIVPVIVYFDYMRSFRVEFDEFFEDGTISEIQVGLGPCGELRYPSYPAKYGWRYPGIGEFQCYDNYLLKRLGEAAKARGHPSFAIGPKDAGSYNSQPHETGFFRDGGDYDNSFGRFFLGWYSKVLIDHGDLVLSLAKLVFEGTRVSVKISGVHWWYKTASHAAELTAGFYNPCNRDGYAPIASMLKKHGATLNFTCVELGTLDQHEDFPEAMADPEGLVWQVLNASWDAQIPMASENALPCYDRDGYNRILENAKPQSNPDRKHLSSFTYLRLSPVLMYTDNFSEFERFVQRMHGQWVPGST